MKFSSLKKPRFPVGKHKATLLTVVPSKTQHGRTAVDFAYGNATHEISQIVSDDWSHGSNLHQLAESMLGKALAVGDGFDASALIGVEFEIVVTNSIGTGDKGYVSSVKPVV